MKAPSPTTIAVKGAFPFGPDSSTVAVIDPKEFALDGLYLSGQVIGRQRREFDGKGGKKRFVISLTLLTAQGTFKPERWTDTPLPSDVPTVGQHVCLRVGLTVYQGKGGTNFRLTWGEDNSGETF